MSEPETAEGGGRAFGITVIVNPLLPQGAAFLGYAPTKARYPDEPRRPVWIVNLFVTPVPDTEAPDG